MGLNGPDQDSEIFRQSVIVRSFDRSLVPIRGRKKEKLSWNFFWGARLLTRSLDQRTDGRTAIQRCDDASKSLVLEIDRRDHQGSRHNVKGRREMGYGGGKFNLWGRSIF